MRGPDDDQDDYWDDEEVDVGRPNEPVRSVVGDEDYWLQLDDEEDFVE